MSTNSGVSGFLGEGTYPSHCGGGSTSALRSLNWAGQFFPVGKIVSTDTQRRKYF